MTFPGSKHKKTYLRTLVGDDAATALLVIDGNDFMGDSKRHPDDQFNFNVGESLAIARALRDAADWYERQAEASMMFAKGGGWRLSAPAGVSAPLGTYSLGDETYPYNA